MSEPLKVAPMCGHANKDDHLQKAINDFVLAIDKIFRKKDDDSGSEEPSSVVTIRKTVTTYEFDAEGLARTAVKTVKAITNGLKWPAPEAEEESEDEASEELGETPRVAKASHATSSPFQHLSSFEGPDGKLEPAYARAVLRTLLTVPGLDAPEVIKTTAPEKHREQLLSMLKEILDEKERSRIEGLARQREAIEARAREARGPIITPPPADVPSADLTPGGRRILGVKTLDEDALKRLHENEREKCVEILVDVPDSKPASFRGTTRNDAAIRADAALDRKHVELVEHEGKSEDEVHYEGDLRDTSPLRSEVSDEESDA